MKRRFASLLSTSFLLLSSLPARAEDADFMRSTGKIYVVVAVILAIFIGLVLYLIRLDRKLTKLENQINEHD